MLEAHIKKKDFRNYTNIWRLSNILLNIKEVRKANLTFLAMKENGNSAYHNLRGAAKVAERCVTMSLYTNKTETLQINNLMVCVEVSERERTNKLRISRKTVKTRTKLNEVV